MSPRTCPVNRFCCFKRSRCCFFGQNCRTGIGEGLLDGQLSIANVVDRRPPLPKGTKLGRPDLLFQRFSRNCRKTTSNTALAMFKLSPDDEKSFQFCEWTQFRGLWHGWKQSSGDHSRRFPVQQQNGPCRRGFRSRFFPGLTDAL